MWYGVFIFIALLLAAVMTVLGGGIFTIILVPIFVAGLAVLAATVVVRQRAGDEASQVVRSQPEPTGRPRGGSAGAGTANERVGQR